MLTFTVVAFRSGVTGTTVSASWQRPAGACDRAHVVAAGIAPSLAEHLSLARQAVAGETPTGTNRLLLTAAFCTVDGPLDASAILNRTALATTATVGGSAMASRTGTRACNHLPFAARPTLLALQGRQRVPASTH